VLMTVSASMFIVTISVAVSLSEHLRHYCQKNIDRTDPQSQARRLGSHLWIPVRDLSSSFRRDVLRLHGCHLPQDRIQRR
jgi:hypothetical protein